MPSHADGYLCAHNPSICTHVILLMDLWACGTPGYNRETSKESRSIMAHVNISVCATQKRILKCEKISKLCISDNAEESY